MLPDLGALQYAVAAAALAVVVAGWAKWFLPRWRKVWRRANSALDTIGGSDAIVDPSSGRELRPAQPPLGTRLASLEDAVVQIVGVVTEMSELRNTVSQHEERLGSLEHAAIERVVSKAESAAAWTAIAEAQKAPPPPEEPA